MSLARHHARETNHITDQLGVGRFMKVRLPSRHCRWHPEGRHYSATHVLHQQRTSKPSHGEHIICYTYDLYVNTRGTNGVVQLWFGIYLIRSSVLCIICDHVLD
jgi:hypothetical protein